MAIYYWDKYRTLHNSRNFGDDINPDLLGKVFDRSVVESQRVCVIGIGTLIDDQKFKEVRHFEKKVVFSSGAGYGKLETPLDESWDIACVRGPKTAEFLNIDASKAVSDGAILLSDFVPPVESSLKKGTLFIPHVNTAWSIGDGLREICERLSIDYIAPDADPDDFVRRINESALLLTEAMHGAIVADTMRTPWVPCSILFHNQFKWADWCAAMNVTYEPKFFGPSFKVQGGTRLARAHSRLMSPLRKRRMEKALRSAARSSPVLSDADLLAEKKARLRAVAQEINLKYG